MDINRPDNFEKGIRFAFGGFVGFFFGLYFAMELLDFEDSFLWLAIILIFILIFGFLAMWKGDDFWVMLSKLLR